MRESAEGGRMITITSKADLNRAVATTAFCPEPPLSKRRAIHESGAWLCLPRRFFAETPMGRWEPADFCGDPAASYRLRQKMRELGWFYASRVSGAGKVWTQFWMGSQDPHTTDKSGEGSHAGECTAFALAALRALGVEFAVAEAWDQR